MKYFLILFIIISIVGCSKNDSDKSSSSEPNEEEIQVRRLCSSPTPVEGALTGTAALGAPLIKSNVKLNVLMEQNCLGLQIVLGSGL